MRRLLGISACVMMAMTGTAAHAFADDPETAQFLCDMTGDCDAGPDAAASTTSAPPVRTPRTGATRGFSFQRATTSDSTSAAPGRPAQTASVSPAAQPRPVRPAAVGSADMKLTFVSGSAMLTEPAKARLAKYAAALANPKLTNRRLRIEGHTDASGSAKTNQLLSQRRAQSVADYLVGKGMAKTRIEVVGYGSSKPLPGVAPTAPENRRVMAVLL